MVDLTYWIRWFTSTPFTHEAQWLSLVIVLPVFEKGGGGGWIREDHRTCLVIAHETDEVRVLRWLALVLTEAGRAILVHRAPIKVHYPHATFLHKRHEMKRREYECEAGPYDSGCRDLPTCEFHLSLADNTTCSTDIATLQHASQETGGELHSITYNNYTSTAGETDVNLACRKSRRLARIVWSSTCIGATRGACGEPSGPGRLSYIKAASCLCLEWPLAQDACDVHEFKRRHCDGEIRAVEQRRNAKGNAPANGIVQRDSHSLARYVNVLFQRASLKHVLHDAILRAISLQSALALQLKHKILGISHATQATAQLRRIEHALYFCARPRKLRGTSNVSGHSGVRACCRVPSHHVSQVEAIGKLNFCPKLCPKLIEKEEDFKYFRAHSEVFRADDDEMRYLWSSVGIQGKGKLEIPEKTRQPTSPPPHDVVLSWCDWLIWTRLSKTPSRQYLGSPCSVALKSSKVGNDGWERVTHTESNSFKHPLKLVVPGKLPTYPYQWRYRFGAFITVLRRNGQPERRGDLTRRRVVREFDKLAVIFKYCENKVSEGRKSEVFLRADNDETTGRTNVTTDDKSWMPTSAAERRSARPLL
ncbi:hypothetical protein PR048_029136 [Dryococelus australis]|uniref:Uncharacterized protein n=1 Tax=Dryococelus australis TaxID=614101 RepID=A0ABQ9GCI1_9NEOP|nr:hypothetical protein PR048_029136 [Dryococelus australis]